MAQSYPRALDQLFDGLGVAESTFDLDEAVAMEELGSGEILTADYGPRLWRGDVTISTDTHAETDQAAARVSVLRAAKRSFLVTQKHRRGPQADPSGVLLGSASPVIASVASNRLDVRVEGLPSQYTLTVGDYVSYSYGGVYGLHQVVESRAAGTNGTIAAIELDPPLLLGVPDGVPLVLVQPRLKAIVVPLSYQPPRFRSTVANVITFSWRQSIR